MKRTFNLYDDLPPETTTSTGGGGGGAAAATTTTGAAAPPPPLTTVGLAQEASSELNPMAQKILRLQQAKAKLKKTAGIIQAKAGHAPGASEPQAQAQQQQPSQQQQAHQTRVHKVAASSNLLLSDLGYGAEEMVIDPYDPAAPNDYSEYARNRAEVRRRERLMRRAAKREKKSNIVLNLHITAEEAYLNRARMSGRTVTELPPPQPLPSQEKPQSQEEPVPQTPETTDLKSLIDGELDGVPWFPDNDIIETLHMQRVMRRKAERQKEKRKRKKGPALQDGIGAKIMEKMGWRDGMGLGRQEQGMTAPLVAVRDRDNAACGEIVAGAEKSGRVVLCLTNMIDPSELDNDFEKEVMDECTKYGKVASVMAKVWNGAVKVFVKFVDEKAAATGLDSLDGRIFGGRKIQAKYYSTSCFDSGDYSL